MGFTVCSWSLELVLYWASISESIHWSSILGFAQIVVKHLLIPGSELSTELLQDVHERELYGLDGLLACKLRTNDLLFRKT